MPFSNIDKPSSYFNTKLYTGTGTTNAITGVGHKPNLLWAKIRGNTYDYRLIDSVRGTSSKLFSNTTGAEVTNTTNDNLVSFDTDGFTFGTTGGTNGTNENGSSFVAWSWRGSDSSAVSNTSGTITSTVSANTTSGFSIVSYTGNGTSGATVGHGLGVAPRMIILKYRNSGSYEWLIQHASIGNTVALFFNTASTSASSTYWNNTSPTSSVFTLGSSAALNDSGGTFIAYCFAEIKGYSKFGSYTGNGSTDGTFVYTGFKPAFVLMKVSSTTDGWLLMDNKRDVYNQVINQLEPSASNAASDNTARAMDFLSNGFKFRSNNTQNNQSGATYIYMAFAENPFVSSKGIPTTAR
jgi:hypothetical protein